MAGILKTLVVGPLEANCYILHDPSGQAVIIDPGGDPQRIVAQCRGLQPQLILLTHGHVDHIAAAAAVKRQLSLRVAAHPQDIAFVQQPHPYFVQLVGGAEPCAVDEAVDDGQELQIGDIVLRLLHTPGHSPGSLCIFWDNAVFTGDTLFAGSIGRTDLPGGSMPVLMDSLRKLLRLTNKETIVYPGHGPATTIGEELQYNPFLEGMEKLVSQAP